MALTRRESEERQAAVLRFFIENPRATGDEAQSALTRGRLPGLQKDQPPMGLGMLFRLKRQAEEQVRKALVPARVAPAPAPAALTEPQLQALRDRAYELQKLLQASGDGILELHVTREGVRIVRLRPTEEKL
jgi:hypothetical protein